MAVENIDPDTNGPTDSNEQPDLRFSQDWFSHNIAPLSEHLAAFVGEPRILGLEIGSFEGRSACWFLSHVLTHKTSRLICIDPAFRDHFDHNIGAIGGIDRVVKIKARSGDVLTRLRRDVFHFVFVDGPHRARSVMLDAVFSWELLKVGGVMIFDDYDWDKIEGDSLSHPRRAVDRFCELVASECELIHQGYSLVLRKTGCDIRLETNKAINEFPDEWPALSQQPAPP